MASRLLTGVGLAMLAFGLWGVVDDHEVTRPLNLALFVFGGLAFHDGVFAPAIGAGGLLLAKVVPVRVRPVVQGALVVTAALVLLSIPVLTGEGRLPGNPSLLPHDYATNLLLVLAVVWAVAGVLAARAARRPRTDLPPVPEPLPPATPGW